MINGNMRRVMSVFLAVGLLVGAAGCASNRATGSANNVQNTATKGESHKYVMMPATFGEHSGVTEAVKAECHMEPRLNSSISSATSKYGVALDVVSTKEELNKATDIIDVKFSNVVSHEWSFLGFRPTSTAAVSIDVINNGKVVKSVTKNIRSRVAIGACGRLNKIADSAGVFVAKWVSRVRY